MNQIEWSDRDLIQFGSKSNPIIIRLGRYGELPIIDIRRYYFDKKKNQLCPTKKGIALRAKNFESLMNVVADNKVTISNWLDKGNEAAYQKATTALMARAKAEQRAREEVHGTSLESSQWRSPTFFKVESHGGTDVITYNENHGFFKALKRFGDSSEQGDIEEAKRLKKILMGVLISYHRAKVLLDDDEMTTGDLCEVLEYEWGMILQNYLEAWKSA